MTAVEVRGFYESLRSSGLLLCQVITSVAAVMPMCCVTVHTSFN